MTSLDQNFGCLEMGIENEFQKNVFEILEVDDFLKYYKRIGVKVKTDEQLYEKLI